MVDEWSDRKEHCWNDTVSGKPAYLQNPLLHCLIFYHISQGLDWRMSLDSERPATSRLNHGMAWLVSGLGIDRLATNRLRHGTVWLATKTFLPLGRTFHWADKSSLQTFEEIWSIKFI